jgi:type I restriction enzyme M protein
VRLLVAMLEPTEGKVFDPCCGSGGMFVQSDIFTHHSGNLAFYGQESKDFTYRLCRMNLFIHGIDGDIRLGNSYTDDKHETLRADYIIANPPFNDGSKGENGWGASSISNKDPRLVLGGNKMPLSPRNANTMWMMHFLYHLADGGTAGFVMATGELSNSETARLEVRKALVDNNYVDCIVQLSGQLFANTQIPCTLWFLSKNRDGSKGYRDRRDEILFIDARKLGALIPGSRKQKQLTDQDVARVASVYRTFKHEGMPDAVSGFCRGVSLSEVITHKYALTPGRYVGSSNGADEGEDYEVVMDRLVAELFSQIENSHKLEDSIEDALRELGYDK